MKCGTAVVWRSHPARCLWLRFKHASIGADHQRATQSIGIIQFITEGKVFQRQNRRRARFFRRAAKEVGGGAAHIADDRALGKCAGAPISVVNPVFDQPATAGSWEGITVITEIKVKG